MLIYEGTKDNFLTSVEQDTIAVEIENKIYEKNASAYGEK